MDRMCTMLCTPKLISTMNLVYWATSSSTLKTVTAMYAKHRKNFNIHNDAKFQKQNHI